MTRHAPYSTYKDSMPKLVTIREKEAFRDRDIFECVIWDGYTTKTGYPVTKYFGKPVRRIVWESTYGNIPKHFIVYSACGGFGCIEPSHLYLEGYRELEKC